MNEKLVSNQFRKGQTVWVRSLQDILSTLDADGKLNGLPFMPEMKQYCGRSFKISCLPTMTCIEGVGFGGFTDIVFLENLRCDGSSHDGCQRDCLLFWKEAWLSDQPVTQSEPGGTELKTIHGEQYFCQSTELAGAASEYQPDKSLYGKLKKILSNVYRAVREMQDPRHAIVCGRVKHLPAAREFEDLEGITKAVGENNDCSVKALAATCGVSYKEAQIALSNLGRRKGCGTSVFNILEAVKALGCKAVTINKKRFIEKYPSPHNTLKNVASQIKKYFENNGNLEIETYTELRKANAPGPISDFDKAMRALAKLSNEEIEIIRKALNGEN